MTARDRLAALVRASGAKQTVLAARVDQPRMWLNNRVRGVTAIQADDLPLLAAALRVPITALLDDATAESVAAGDLADVSESVTRLLLPLSPEQRAAVLTIVEGLVAMQRARPTADGE